jgi:hypothetical protein
MRKCGYQVRQSFRFVFFGIALLTLLATAIYLPGESNADTTLEATATGDFIGTVEPTFGNPTATGGSFDPTNTPTTTPTAPPTNTPTATATATATPIPLPDHQVTVTGDPRSPFTRSAAIPGTVGVTYVLGTAPILGSVVVAPDGSFTYTANKNKKVTDSFTMLATDSNGDTAIVTVTLIMEKDKKNT